MGPFLKSRASNFGIHQNEYIRYRSKEAPMRNYITAFFRAVTGMHEVKTKYSCAELRLSCIFSSLTAALLLHFAAQVARGLPVFCI